MKQIRRWWTDRVASIKLLRVELRESQATADELMQLYHSASVVRDQHRRARDTTERQLASEKRLRLASDQKLHALLIEKRQLAAEVSRLRSELATARAESIVCIPDQQPLGRTGS